ncbi:unnamed protein product [Auanema sp. JU1783]|nr:unnamed protein product [Auanema sp. JU1783]
MDRLLELEFIIQEISNVEPEILEDCVNWKETADDIILKLRDLHIQMSHKYPSSNTLLTMNNSLLTPPHSAHSTSSTSSIHSDSSLFGDENYSLASQAFDRQIYSRCVRIVENAQRNGPIEMPLITLAHHSYLAMVEGTDDDEAALKFICWWIQFLEAVEPGRSISEKNELFEYRLKALEKLYHIENGQKSGTSMQILKLLIRSYKNSLASYRSFHPAPLRKLEQLATWVDELKEQCEDSMEYCEASALLEEGIASTERDKRKYENEQTSMKTHISRNKDYYLCYEIMRTLSQASSSSKDNSYQFEEQFSNSLSSSEEDIIIRL